MTKVQLPKLYLRIDPNIDQVYPELRSTFVGLLCAANRQPVRGRFRDRRTLEGLLGRSFVRRLYDRGDVVDLPDGRVYVPGWQEWQEGDCTVAERQRRIRSRRDRGVTAPLHQRDETVTATVTDVLRTDSLLVGTEEGRKGGGVVAPAEDDGFDRETWTTLVREAETITGQPYALGSPHARMGSRVLALVGAVGIEAVLRAWREVARAHEPGRPILRQLVFEGENLAAPIGDAHAERDLDDWKRKAAEQRTGLRIIGETP